MLAVMLLGMGCDEAEITERAVPKGVETIAEPRREAGGSAEPMPWTVPEGWRRVADDAPMRLATFVSEEGGAEAKVLVSRFPGDVGGELANVNRWRRQVGLGAIDAAQLESLVRRFGEAGREGYLVRLRGTGSVLVAAGVHEARADRTWFVKSIVSSTAIADRVEAEILAFARSIGAADRAGSNRE